MADGAISGGITVLLGPAYLLAACVDSVPFLHPSRLDDSQCQPEREMETEVPCSCQLVRVAADVCYGPEYVTAGVMRYRES